MSEERDLEEERWQLRWAAEVSSRYHRRRAAWLGNVDFVLNIVQMLSGTAAFIALTNGTPGRLAAIGSVIVVLCSLVQIVGRLGKATLDHELLMRQWCDLLTDIEAKSATEEAVGTWVRTKGELNKAHVGELRALAVAAENEAAFALGAPGRQRIIGRVQWLLMHIVSYQRSFLPAPDLYPAAPLQVAQGE